MKKILVIGSVVIVVLLFVFMLKQNSGYTVAEKAPIVDQNVPVTTAENVAVLPQIDEQAAALKEMERSVGKSGLSKEYIVKCSACHGRDGKGPIGPSIAGKDVKYNMAALLKYKNKQVPNTMMKGLLENTSEAQLQILATEIASFK